MPSRTEILSLIQRNILFFSIIVFAVSGLLLFGIFWHGSEIAIQPDKLPINPWWKLAEEILKGLLVASAIAFLYDWILKRETTTQMSYIIHDELQAINFGAQEIDEYTRVDNSIETVLAPLNNIILGANQKRFCRASVHHKFLMRYLEDEVDFVFLISDEELNVYRNNSTCLLYWCLDEAPLNAIDKSWFEVVGLKIDGISWSDSQTIMNGKTIVITFKKPANSTTRRGQIVTYEFDVRTIENISSITTLTIGINQKMIRPIFRVDARPLRAASVKSDISFRLSKKKLLQSPYVPGIEGQGTCQMFVADTIQQGGFVTFKILMGEE